MSKIKICGITTEEEIQFINRMAVDYIGFVFAESTRQISFERAFDLSKCLKGSIGKVGVFVNPKREELLRAIEIIGLDVIQLHGHVTPDLVHQLDPRVEIWKAISIKDENSIKAASKYQPLSNRFVFDTYSKTQDGGTGKTFRWKHLSPFENRERIILAGGLNPQNVREAIQSVAPYCVDVSSGVERNGKKSPSLVEQFIREVKRNE